MADNWPQALAAVRQPSVPWLALPEHLAALLPGLVVRALAVPLEALAFLAHRQRVAARVAQPLAAPLAPRRPRSC